jgi:glycosyltransferase involved in cell wall biosynthesis
LGMRIAQVAPLYESVPPKYYGGTERVVSYLTEELVRQGHEVTLFASGDSETKARLVAACRRSLRLDKRYRDQMAHHYVILENVFQRAAEFDIIHFHIATDSAQSRGAIWLFWDVFRPRKEWIARSKLRSR